MYTSEDSSSEDEIIGLITIMEACEDVICIPPKKKIKRKHWVRPWIGDRDLINQNNTMFKLQLQLRDTDVDEFHRMLRMNPETFEFILGKIDHRIRKQETPFRASILPSTRLAITLKYLATGESTLSLSQQYRVGRSTVSKILHETTTAIYDVLRKDYLKTPNTAADWLQVAMDFWNRWQYPGCLGAIDGKHVRIVKPWKSGSTFYNYKGYFSIVIMAVANANYDIIYIDVGAEGKVSDGGIWGTCSLKEHMERNTLNIPDTCYLPNTQIEVPLHMVGDDAFPLSKTIMKPYAHRNLSHEQLVFNYRLSRARRIIENVFGILCTRFHVLHTAITMRPSNAEKVLKACVVLHNVLNNKNRAQYINPGLIDGEDGIYNMVPGDWRHEDMLPTVQPTHLRNAPNRYKLYRDEIKNFFNSNVGAVSWQNQQIANQML